MDDKVACVRLAISEGAKQPKEEHDEWRPLVINETPQIIGLPRPRNGDQDPAAVASHG